MQATTESNPHSPEVLLHDLRTLLAEAEKMVGDSDSEPTDSAVCALRERFDATQERLTELYAGAKRQIAGYAKRTDATIRENPYQALVVAGGFCLLAGVLLGRRSK